MFDIDTLVSEARNVAGLDDFGPLPFREALEKLLGCIEQAGQVSAEGAQSIRQEVIRSLVNRLRMQSDITLHPEILEEDVSDPIIVTGLGRSGTTKMHKLLSEPDSVQKTLLWRLLNPAPFPGAVPGEDDPRIHAAGSADLVAVDNKAVKAAHIMQSNEVDEEWILYTHTFDDWIWCAFAYLPSYFDWSLSRPSLPKYEYVKSMLQYLQWQDGGRRGRRWVLKSVGYIADMDSVIHCYPNAVFLHTHRDPRDSIPSWAKFVSELWTYKAASTPPKEEIGALMLHYWSTAMKRYLESRDRLQLDDRIMDVPYQMVRSNPIQIARNLYDKAGMSLSIDAESAMLNWHQNNEQFKHGKHEYSLNEFGLNEAMIDDAFADYIERFIER